MDQSRAPVVEAIAAYRERGHERVDLGLSDHRRLAAQYIPDAVDELNTIRVVA